MHMPMSLPLRQFWIFALDVELVVDELRVRQEFRRLLHQAGPHLVLRLHAEPAVVAHRDLRPRGCRQQQDLLFCP